MSEIKMVNAAQPPPIIRDRFFSVKEATMGSVAAVSMLGASFP